MSPRRHANGFQRSRLTYLLGAAVIAAAVIAYTSVGAASSQSSESTRTATAQSGVVQSTVSGSGTIEPVSQLDLGFKTAGTVTRIYVSEGEHVKAGELIAELNPKSAEAALEQARASLQSAQASLAVTEERGGETSSSGGAGAGAATSNSGSSNSGSTGSSNGGPSNTGSSSSSTPRESAATREANLASARAAVTSDSLAVQNAEQALQDTKLYAPETRHDRFALRRSRRNRLGVRDHEGLQRRIQLVRRRGFEHRDGAKRPGHGQHRVLRLVAAPRAPRSRCSASSARCSSWCL